MAIKQIGSQYREKIEETDDYRVYKKLNNGMILIYFDSMRRAIIFNS